MKKIYKQYALSIIILSACIITKNIVPHYRISLTRSIINRNQHNTTAKKIAVIGTGYVGVVTGAGLAYFGHNVICVDSDVKKIALLQQGEIPIYEPGLKNIIDHAIDAGHLTFTNDIENTIQSVDVIFIAVGTPMAEDGSADLSAVENVVNTIAQNLNSYKVICTKSTVPIGTGAWIQSILEQRGINKDMFDIVSNPEFLREGSAINDFLEPDRVVIGTASERALGIMYDVYKPLFANGIPPVLTNTATSETIKYAANAFLAVKLSFINEIANLCDATGADVQAVAYAMGLDKRISPQFLKPGPGFGGSCFPKDSNALLYMSKQCKDNVDLKVVEASLEANEQQKRKPIEKLLRLMNNDIKGKTIAILGLSFKANTDDIRYSPAITTIKNLLENGAYVKAYDPIATENMRQLFSQINYCESLYATVTGADAIIVITEWDEFKYMDLEKIAGLVNNRVIIDARNIIDPDEMRRLDFTFDTIGRSCLRYAA